MPYEMVEVSVQARQGDSGGPILNQRGELAGVLFGSGSGTTSGSYAGRVSQFLATAWPQETLPQETLPQETLPQETQVARAEASTPPGLQRPADQQRDEIPQPSAKATEVALGKSSPQTNHLQNHPTESPVTAQRPIPFRSAPFAARHETTVDTSEGDVLEIHWESLAGKTIGEQVKSVLAMIGVCAIILHLLSGSKKE